MSNVLIPKDEADRLEAVRGLGLIETPSDERFDRYTRLAVHLFDVPTALFGLVEEDRQWFKSKHGFASDELPRDLALCSYAILGDDLLVVNDATRDERFKDNPLVTGEPGIRFYAGCPIRTRGGANIGTLAVIDYVPRVFEDSDLLLLKDLAAMIDEDVAIINEATIDELTGLSNRRGFRAIANPALAVCRRLDRPASLMFFDLDEFKEVNDNYGHAEGDKALIQVAGILLNEFRNSDVIARLGGDEFCVLLTGTSANDVERPIQNLDESIRQWSETVPYRIGYSVGTVTYDVDKHPTINDLLAAADRSMYENKRLKKTGPEAL